MPLPGYPSRNDYCEHCREYFRQFSPEQQALVPIWLEIGRRNPWIMQATDPPFDVLCFDICRDVRHLAEQILQGNWSLGSAFVLDDLCFIDQVNGGDEWLTIKGRTPFESITMQTFQESLEDAESRPFATVERIQRATEEQCRRLRY